MKSRQKVLGFTLLELMITLVIISVLAAIAIPSYMNSVRKSNRTEAKAELMNIAQLMQRCYTSYARYDSPNCDVYKLLSNSPAKITTRGSGFYDITLSAIGAAPAQSYTLLATAVKTPQTQDTTNNCNLLTLTSTGIKGPIPSGATVSPCW